MYLPILTQIHSREALFILKYHVTEFVHEDLDSVLRLLRHHLSNGFTTQKSAEHSITTNPPLEISFVESLEHA